MSNLWTVRLFKSKSEPTVGLHTTTSQPVLVLHTTTSQPVLGLHTTTSQPVLGLHTTTSQPVLGLHTTTSQPVLGLHTTTSQPVHSCGWSTIIVNKGTESSTESARIKALWALELWRGLSIQGGAVGFPHPGTGSGPPLKIFKIDRLAD